MKTSLPFLVVGNPENRRVGLFQAALAAQGQPPARVVPWLDVIRHPACLDAIPDEPAFLRIDSCGESFDVEKELLLLGHEEAVALGATTLSPRAVRALEYDKGQVLAPRQLHLGFLRVLARLEAAIAAHPRWIPLARPATIAELFDKRQTSRRYAALGVPVPRSLGAISTPDELDAAMAAAGVPTVYVKLSSGSSASCLGVYHRGPRPWLFTTLEDTGRALYNSLRVRRVTELRRLERLLGFLLREGSQVEESVPKARLGNRFFDCRILCVRGEPAFLVVRQSPHPITNLHLGGRRGDPDALRAAAGPGALTAAEATCRTVAAAHQAFQIGIDLMFEPRFDHHRVLEANAFGDLLPNLCRDGLSVYEWEIREALRLVDGR